MEDIQLKELLEELTDLPKETEWVEFKMNNKNHEEIGEYISALSNSACLYDKKNAYLVFGVEDKSHNIRGTKFCPRKEKIGAEELENWLARLLSPRIDFKIFEFEYSNKKMVLFKIDAATNKPVSFKGIGYIRLGSYKKKLKDHSEKERKIWKKTSDIVFEKEIALSNVKENDIFTFLDTPSYFRLMNQPPPSSKKEILDKLEKENLIIKKYPNFDITNLGALLFATKLSDFEKLARKTIRVITYKGKDKLRPIKEQIGGKGYAAGFEGLVKYINDLIPSNEEIIKAIRRKVKMYPEIAIRELVVNALIHQDFGATGMSPMIELYENRIEISNPGAPLINTLRFIDHPPKSRNEILASLMRRLNICEERGSGIDKVIFNVEMFQLPAPDFVGGSDFLKVTMYSPRSLRQMGKDGKMRACYQHCVLKYTQGEKMTNESLRSRFRIDERNYATASRIISDTLKRKFIKIPDVINKSRKYAQYVPFWA